MNTKRTCFASVVSISEIEQSEIYLTIKARLFETPGANLNGVRVTAAFLDEIVEHQEAYIGVPLYADVKNLATKNFEHLGHLYDANTGEFHSTQIGSFYRYEKETTADGAALIGYARVMKRDRAVCNALAELFATNALKFSFEINCGSYETCEDGTMMIDASKENYLEGAAVVSFPACRNAVALQLIAEYDETEKGVRILKKKNVLMTDETAEKAIAEEAIAEEAEKTAEIAEEKPCEAKEETAEVRPTEEEPADKEGEDEEGKKEVAQTEVSEKIPEENELPEEEEKEAKKEKKESAKEEDDEETASCGKKKTAEEETEEESEDDSEKKIAELATQVEALAKIVAELTKKIDESKVIAEVTAEAEEEEIVINPIVAELKVEEPHYSLLESVKSDRDGYTLL